MKTKIGLEKTVIDEGVAFLMAGDLESFEAHARQHTPMLKIDEMMRAMRRYGDNRPKAAALWTTCAREYIPRGLVYTSLVVVGVKWIFIAAALLGGVLYLWDRCAG
jgi:hypothetical protein